MSDFDIDKLLKIQIQSQKNNIDTSDEFEKGTKVKILNTNDKHLENYIGNTGITDNTIRYKHVKKTKVLFSNGESAYFKNDFLQRIE